MAKEKTEDDSMDDVVPLPIDGELDLHTFSPREIKYLIPDYIEECRERGILELRIVHGKGTGTLRRTVHSLLDKLPEVQEYRLRDMTSGSWDTTLVTLYPKTKEK